MNDLLRDIDALRCQLPGRISGVNLEDVNERPALQLRHLLLELQDCGRSVLHRRVRHRLGGVRLADAPLGLLEESADSLHAGRSVQLRLRALLQSVDHSGACGVLELALETLGLLPQVSDVLHEAADLLRGRGERVLRRLHKLLLPVVIDELPEVLGCPLEVLGALQVLLQRRAEGQIWPSHSKGIANRKESPGQRHPCGCHRAAVGAASAAE
mmetsp:Transcript_5943/g.13556  ORF Transcript_5943/g.13556 Transcript_5943/m.13556 type:complete len:213 (-) Transcript_5943:39-677(-)